MTFDDIFLSFVPKTDCGAHQNSFNEVVSKEYPLSVFLSHNKKSNVPVNPTFPYTK